MLVVGLVGLLALVVVDLVALRWGAESRQQFVSLTK